LSQSIYTIVLLTDNLHLEKPLWEIWQIFAKVEKIFDKDEKSFPEFINEKYIIQIWEMQNMLRKYVKFSK
jgi:hypothetical protein